MPSIFDAADNIALQQRIGMLTPDTRCLWGTMSVEQMLVHCQRPLQVAMGTLQLKRTLLGMLLGGVAKRSMLRDAPIRKNLPTVTEFMVGDGVAFDEARRTLLHLIADLGHRGPAALTSAPHPFFGRLKTAEWDTLQWKHLDHHLRQFGV